MPWTKEEKIFCVTIYLATKSFKTVQAKFRRKFNFNNYPQKSQIYRWAHKFQATGSLNNLNKKGETPRFGRKFILAIDMAREQEECFVAEPNIIKKVRILFDLVFEPLAHYNTFFHVSWCEFMLDLDPVWVQLKILDHDSLHRCTWKAQFLATSSNGLL